MRNIKKFAKELNLEYKENEYGVTVVVKNITFKICRKESTSMTSWSGRRSGSPAGYRVSNNVQRYGDDEITQKDVIGSIVQTLRYNENTTKEEMKVFNDYLYDLYYK